MHTYRAFGLIFSSAIELPELTSAEGEPEAWIEESEVPPALAAPTLRGFSHEASATEAVLRVDGVARFHIAEGRRLSFEREAGASDRDVRAFLLSTPLALLLLQRGIVPLHASVVEIDGGCLAFLGRSGSGKSSLAAWFGRHGHALLGDDICALVPGPDGTPRVMVGVPRLKLWADTLHQLERSSDGLTQVRDGIGKFALPRETVDAAASWPLRHACALSVVGGEPESIRPVTGARKLAVLLRHTFGGTFLPTLDRSAHFRTCSAAARAAQVWQLNRPRRSDRLLAGVARLVESALRGGSAA